MLIPPTYNAILKNMFFFFFIFVAIAIAVFCASKIVVFVYFYKEVSGAFSGIAYFFDIICNVVLLFQKNSLWASISLFTNQNALVFTYK